MMILKKQEKKLKWGDVFMIRYKKLISIFLLFLFLMMLFIPLFTTISSSAEENNSIRARKIVSVCYDDSGSMLGDSWSYTNYAMQAFTGMLDEYDTLMINYMSSSLKEDSPPEVIDLKDRATAVSKIRDHEDCGATPFETVKAAFNNLSNTQDSNEYTQYWLFILTDGGFTGATKSEVEEKLANWADTKMPNGTLPNIVFLSINDFNGEYSPKSGIRNNISVYTATNEDEITTQISSIAYLITGRYAVEKSDINVIDDKTIEVNSNIPLFKIGVLSQQSKANVVSVKGVEGNDLSVQYNVGINCPDNLCATNISTLNGNISLIDNNGKNIPPGKYTIEFDDSISKDKLDVMFEPALQLKLKVFSSQNEITDFTDIPTSLVLSAKAEIYEFGTDNKILLSMLPSGGVSTTKQLEDNQEIKSNNDLSLDNIVLSTKQTTIISKFELPGYFILEDHVVFTPNENFVGNIEANFKSDGSELFNENDPSNSVYISRMASGDNKSGVEFTIYISGKPNDKDTSLSMLDEFKSSIKSEVTMYDVVVEDDGKYLVTPKIPWYCPQAIFYMFNHGEKSIGVTLDNVSAQDTVYILIGDILSFIINTIIFSVILLFFIYILLWIFVKKKLPSFSIEVYEGKYNGSQADFSPITSSSVGGGYFTAKNFLNFISLNPNKISLPFNDNVYFQAARSIHREEVEIIGLQGKCFSQSVSTTWPTRLVREGELPLTLCEGKTIFIRENSEDETDVYKYIINF